MMDAAKAGLRFLIITAFLYTAAVWALSRILFNAGILDGDLNWGACSIIGISGLLLRTWDRTFFRKF